MTIVPVFLLRGLSNYRGGMGRILQWERGLQFEPLYSVTRPIREQSQLASSDSRTDSSP